MSQPPPAEYEVLRVDGMEDDCAAAVTVAARQLFSPAAAAKKAAKRKHERHPRLEVVDSPTKMKRLRLRLGQETVSTVNYS